MESEAGNQDAVPASDTTGMKSRTRALGPRRQFGGVQMKDIIQNRGQMLQNLLQRQESESAGKVRTQKPCLQQP